MKRVHPNDPLVVHEWRESLMYEGVMVSLCEKLIVAASSFYSTRPPGAEPRPLCLKCIAAKSKMVESPPPS